MMDGHDVITLIFCLLCFATGYTVGYTYGEDHATSVALRAQWEREAKEWDKRHEDSLRH